MSDPDSEDPAELLPPPGLVGRLKARLKRLADWRRDDVLRRLYRNASLMVAGEGTAALIGLVSIGLTTRALGTFEWGVLATVIAFTHLVGVLVKFQTWQAVVKFGADALARDDAAGLKSLVRFTTVLDLSTAVIAALVCVLTMPWFMAWSGLDDRYQEFALFYSAAALLTVSATPMGLLRLFDRFDILSRIPPLTAVFRLAGCTVVWLADGGLWHFGAVWLASALFDRLMHFVMGWRELARRKLAGGMLGSIGEAPRRHPGLWRFAVAGNLQASLNALTKESDTLLIARIVGPEAAGLWVLAKRFASVLAGPARMFLVSIFPQLAKLWAAHDYRHFRRLILRSSALGGAGGIVVLVVFGIIGEYLIRLVAGEQFVGALWLTLLIMSSRVVTLFAMPLNPALLAMNRPLKSLKIAAVVALVLLPLLALFTYLWGPIGAGCARIVAEFLPLAWMLSVVMRTIRRHVERADRLRT